MKNAVFVVDMTRGFCQEGHALYCGSAAREIIPAVDRLLRRETEAGSAIFFLNDSHDKDDAEFKLFPAHCISGSEETEIIPELARYPGVVVNKTRYSGFWKTDLDKRLEKLNPGRIIICGVCTDICVMFTAAEAMYRGYDIEIPVECVASFDGNAHQFALKHMHKLFGARLTHLE